MAWCEANTVDYVFGLPGNRILHADPVFVSAADAVCVDRATRGWPVLRRLWTVRQALPETAALRVAEFATIRLRLIKLAARVIETASRIRIAFASACLDADIFRAFARALRPAPT